ncbi:MAG: aminotransferase class V-fold PLP-dependent enzyme, partial [Candidatus Paceibacteria bacterium]
EHHSNILPWQKYAEKRNVKVRFIPIDPQTYTLDTSALSQYITARTRIVSVSHISNALGTVVDVESIIQRAREVGAWVVLDICQSIGHLTDSIRALDTDVLVFSGHKMYGPTGVGGYWARLDLLNVLKPAQWGG